MVEFGRVDCCRNCGSQLEVITVCEICEQPHAFRCSNCYHFVDDPIHTECMIDK